MPGALLILLLFACRTTLEPSVPPRDDAPKQWGALLEQAVDEDGYVDYDRIARRKVVLDRYVAWLKRERVGRIARPAYRRAHWINAFNGLVIYQILERGRPDSVLDAPGWPRGAGFFYWTAFPLDGNRLTLSLWEIGYERILAQHQDYREFAALHLGARSSPPLRAGLYTGDTLGQQLDEAFTRWMMDRRGVRLEGGRALFNPIFQRHARQFAHYAQPADLCTLAVRHTRGKRRARLKELADQGCPHGFFDFDWRLNDASEPEDP